MPYRYLEDIAPGDIPFETVGGDPGEVFRDAWAAVLNVLLRAMVVLDT